MTLEFVPIALNSNADHEGMLVLQDGKLAAVLARLSEQHREAAGHWFLECGFGLLSHGEEQFSDLDAVRNWINEALANRG